MKRLLLMVATLMAALTASAQTAPERHGWSEEVPLHGDVEWVGIKTYELEEQDGELFYDEAKNTEVYEFNKAGNVFSYSCWDGDGNLIYMKLYGYNSEGKCSDLTEYDSEGNLLSKYEYFYNSEGKLTETHRYNSEEILYLKEIYKYDLKGNMTRQENKNPDGTLEVGYFFEYEEYDGINNLIKEMQYDCNGIIAWEIEYSFPLRSTNPTEKILYLYGDNNTEQKWTYEYNGRGDLCKEYIYDTEGKLKSEIIYKYNTEGLLVGSYYFDSEMNLKWGSLITYDNNGNKTTQATHNSQGEVTSRLSCKYDSSNNVIEIIEYYSPEEGFTSEYKEFTIGYRTE